jgi:pectin methylesterase-like acyl-CoA thioesterase
MVIMEKADRAGAWFKLSLVLAILVVSGSSSADTLPVVRFLPTAGATGVCEDTHLSITYQAPPTLNSSGTLRIRKVSDDSIVWQVGLLATPTVMQISVAGKTLNYYPVLVIGNTVEVIPQNNILQYDTEYYITMTAAFVTSSADSSAAITDNTTWRFRTRASAPPADQDYLVASDGTGDFCTIQGAVNAVPDNSPTRTIIRIKNGAYRELINVPVTKKNMTWLGQDRDNTRVVATNNDSLNSGASARCMIEINADDFRVYNMMFRNSTPQGGTQAEALKVGGSNPVTGPQRCLASNCKFYSYQDTLLITGTMYFADCYIEGDVDYIWGYGSTYFERCQLNSVRTAGYNLMPRNGQGVPGYIFVDCTLTAPAGITGVYLARDAGLSGGVPYFPYGQVIYITSKMGSHIAAIGWKITPQYDPAKLFLAEYHSMDLNGNLLNVSGRDPMSRQLDDANGLFWRDPVNTLGGWDPHALADPPLSSWLPQPSDGTVDVSSYGVTLTWAAGANATSHIVYFGTDNPPALAGEQTSSSYATGPMALATTYYWRVDEKNAYGVTTGDVWSFIVVPVPIDITPPSPSPMTWAVPPHATGPYSISMTATSATDDSGVEYNFLCTFGGHTSGWQDSPVYVDTRLDPSTTCIYMTSARDKSPAKNASGTSSPASATTDAPPDDTAPTPDPMGFDVGPHATGLDSIAMVAATASDASGVEYFFANTSDASHFSGWQSDPNWIDTGLVRNTLYSYRVKARDMSPQLNETAWSAPESAATMRYVCSEELASDLHHDCQVDFVDYAVAVSQWGVVGPLGDIAVNGTFDTAIAPGWQLLAAPGATGSVSVILDDSYGDPIPSAYVMSDAGLTGADKNFFFQVVPVHAGKQYKLSAEWDGDISGTVSYQPGAQTWAQVCVNFTDTPPDADTTDWGAVMYRKAHGAVDLNVDPSGIWYWEPITASPAGGPTDGIFTATGSYMTIAFSFGGLPFSGGANVSIDDVMVETTPCVSIDLNSDCMLNMDDLRVFALQWLSCTRDPVGECWVP